MIRHLARIVLARWRSNALVTTEIFACFLVVAGVAVLGLFLADNWRRPLGFDPAGVLVVEVHTGEGVDAPADTDRLAAVLREVEALPEIVAAAAGSGAPYDGSTETRTTTLNGRNISMQVTTVTDGYAGVMAMQVTRGRWFEPGDDGLGYEPVVVNERLARALFDSADPIGQRLVEQDSARDRRVVGVIPEYRKAGEFAAPVNYIIHRASLAKSGSLRSSGRAEGRTTSTAPEEQPPVLRALIARARADVSGDYPEVLLRRLRAIAPDWDFDVQPMERMRSRSNAVWIAPVAAGVTLAAFLLSMAGLGLIGVLWQNVTRRTREIGLRRAAGASATDIRRQIVTEMLLLATLGTLAGLAVLVQVPLLGWLGPVNAGSYALALALASLAIYAMAGLAALYPATLATRIEPAAALHDE